MLFMCLSTGMLIFSDKNKVGWEFVATIVEKLEPAWACLKTVLSGNHKILESKLLLK